MTAKEYLEQIGRLEHKIACMKDRADYYDHMSYSIPGQDFTRERVQTPPNYEAPFLRWLIKLDEIKREIAKKEDELKNLKAEALMKIEALDNEDYKNVLIYRYFDHKKWGDIAAKMYASEKTVRRWHENALQAIKT